MKKPNLPRLKFVYSHQKEKEIAKHYSERLKSLGKDESEFSKPASDEDAKRVIAALEKAWEPKEKKFVEKLNWFYDSDFKIGGWTAYLLRLPFCPYWTKGKWFGVYLSSSIENRLRAIGHELFHQPFHLYWKDKCENIFEKVQNPKNAKENSVVRSLKEALPELLNTPEFRVSDKVDKGHYDSGEQFIRHLIRKYYKEHGPFKFREFLESIS